MPLGRSGGLHTQMKMWCETPGLRGRQETGPVCLATMDACQGVNSSGCHGSASTTKRNRGASNNRQRRPATPYDSHVRWKRASAGGIHMTTEARAERARQGRAMYHLLGRVPYLSFTLFQFNFPTPPLASPQVERSSTFATGNTRLD